MSSRAGVRAAIGVMALVVGGVTHAGFFDLMFNDETADVWGGIEFGKNDDSGFLLAGRYLYTDEDEVDASVPAVLLAFEGRASANEDIDFRVGLQGFFGEVADQDVEGVGIGGSGNWAPDAFKGGYVGARLYYAPGIFAFGDTESILDWGIEGGYRINEKFRAFLQYAKLKVEVEVDDVEFDVDVDQGLLLGFGITF
jgi:hypothetical protein